MNIWPQGGHIFQKTAGWPPFPALCHMPHTVLLHAYRPCRRFIIPHSQNPPFAFGPAPLRVWHLLRQAHPSLSLAFAKWINYTTFSGHTPRLRPHGPGHAVRFARPMPHPPCEASRRICQALPLSLPAFIKRAAPVLSGLCFICSPRLPDEQR